MALLFAAQMSVCSFSASLATPANPSPLSREQVSGITIAAPEQIKLGMAFADFASLIKENMDNRSSMMKTNQR